MQSKDSESWTNSGTQTAPRPEAVDGTAGWLRSPRFDLTFICGISAVAILSGILVTLQPSAFTWVLMADLWLLGYHHVVSTFTRLSFDKQSFKEYRFFLFVLPPIVFLVTFGLAWYFGIWIVASVYLYWQWFHYTRQSWGVSRVYQGKSPHIIKNTPWLDMACFYLLPLWGILYRSWQAPDTFIFAELVVIPIPGWLVAIVAAGAIITILYWCFDRLRLWKAGVLPKAHTYYMLSHYVIFSVGYLLIEDITTGWLVINIWHNAQYILFVWLHNTNRFKNGIDDAKPFLSTISQRQHLFRYLTVCLGISTLIYATTSFLTYEQFLIGIPLAIVFYQAVNFHHYIVDSRIWKVRAKALRSTMGLTPNRNS